MFKITKKTILLVSFVLFSLSIPMEAHSLRIGMSPSVVDIGDVERGTNYQFDFYLMTNHEKDLLVELSGSKAPYEFYYERETRIWYKFNSSLASEEDVSGWLFMLENPVVLPPETFIDRLPNGLTVNANKKVTAILEIPDDAEPGYHAGFIHPKPVSETQGRGTALGIITVVDIAYVFNVKGDAERSGKIIGFTYDISRDSGTVGVVFKNTGTLTMGVKARDVVIYDNSGENQIARLNSREYQTSPGEIITIPIKWYNSSMDEGQYPVEARVEWFGGESQSQGRIVFTKMVSPSITGDITGDVPAPLAAPLPIWIIPIFVFVAGFLLYRWKR